MVETKCYAKVKDTAHNEAFTIVTLKNVQFEFASMI